MVATALTHGSVRLAAFEPDRISNPLTRALMNRIFVSVDPEIDAAFPGRRAARLEIETRDGRRGEYFQPNRKGDPELPLTDRDLEAKFIELVVPVLGQDKARALLDRLWAIDRVGRVSLA